MAGLFVSYPSLSGSGGGGGLSSISFSIGTLDAGTINQNGASVSSNSIFLQSATSIFPGLINSASQTFSGVKTFINNVAHKQLVSIGSGFSTGVMLTISSNTAFAAPVAGTNLHIIGADGVNNRLLMDSYDNLTAGGAPGLFLRRARGTGGTPTAVQLNDTLGFFGALGYGTTAFAAATGGTLSFKAAQNQTDTNQGTYLHVGLVINSTTTSFQRLFLSDVGVLRLSGYADQTGPIFTTGSGGTLISGSVSLVNQVSGILPAANLPPLSGITGSVSLTTQVSGLLPQSNIGSLSASYNVGAIDTATASVNGAVIGTSSLYMQSASVASPGIMNTSTTQSFTGIKSFVRLGINNTSGSAGLYAVSSGLATNTVTIQGLSGQTSLGLNVIDSAGNPKVVYDFNAGALRLFVNANETAECNFDNRATVVTGAISSGSIARFNFVCSDQSALGAGKGGGIAFGASQTGSTTVTEFGYVWATKNNANAGDLDGTLHLASRNNASGKAQRGIDIDQLGNSVHFGQVQMAGALNGQLNLSAGSSVATYTITLPSAQGSTSSVQFNDGSGNMSWRQALGCQVDVIASGSGTYAPRAGAVALKVTVIGGGGAGGGVNSGAAASCAGGGGGGGGSCIKWLGFNSTSGQTYSYVVGEGGATGSGSANGAVGTSSVFANILAFGGSGGTGGGNNAGPVFTGAGGLGGNGSGADITVRGGGGTGGIILSVTQAQAGAGGDTILGKSLLSLVNVNAGGNIGQLYGGGGGGACNTNNGGVAPGGGGATGVIIVENYFA